MSTLHHISIAWPLNVPTEILREQGIAVTPTMHALEQAIRKDFRCPRVIPCGAKAFEVELSDSGCVLKTGFRWKISKNTDICVIISNDARVITAWLNDSVDTHKTLDRTKYSREVA